MSVVANKEWKKLRKLSIGIKYIMQTATTLANKESK